MTSDLSCYSDYVNSGLAWVGQIPSHWSLIPNRGLVRKKKVLVGSRHTDYELLSLTKQGVIVRDISTGKGKFSSDMGTCQEVRNGDLIFCLFDIPETPRTVGLSPHDGMITGAYTVFEALPNCRADYFELFYRAMDDRKLLSPLYSGLRNTISPDRFLGTKTPQPPPDEQSAIVHFLGWATVHLNRAIRAKRQVIALLNEQKQVIVYRAATRGLDPSTPLKDTGIPWLAQIPSHWSLVPNRGLVRKKKVLVGSRHTDYELLSLTKQGVIVRDISTGKGKFSSDMGTCQEVRNGDLIFCLFDIPETPRTVGLSPHDGMITGAYTVFEALPNCRADYFELFYRAMDDRKLLSPLYSGLRNTISPDRFLGTKTPQPPPDEQSAIVAHINDRMAPLNRQISRLEHEIALLREYRTRLVFDVATGKLDVRVAVTRLSKDATTGITHDEPDGKAMSEANVAVAAV